MRHLLAACVLVPAAALLTAQAGLFSSSVPAAAQGARPSAPKAKPCDQRCSSHWQDANLRLDQLQLIGTGESYKQKPDGALMGLIRMGGKKDAEALDYGMPSLTRQLDADVRSLSFDVAYDPQGGAYKSPAGASMAMDLLPDNYVAAMKKPGFKAVHVLDVDYQSSCLALTDCLAEVSAWSKAHPRHLPIVIALRTNDTKTPMPGATKPALCDEAALAALDSEIQAAFAPEQIFTPEQMQGRHASVREAAMAHAWPLVGALRGKVIFVLNDAPKAKAYSGKLMFAATSEDAPQAAFVAIADPLKETKRIHDAVRAGFMVITRADDDTREARRNDTARRDAAFASGAQIVQTNFAVPDPKIGPYKVSLADNADALCDTATAQAGTERCVRFQTVGAMPTVAAIAP